MLNVLNLIMTKHDAGSQPITVRQYLLLLLEKLWREAEGFSSKRPFGNGDWQLCIYRIMIQHALVEGTINDYDEVEGVDGDKADAIIINAMQELK